MKQRYLIRVHGKVHDVGFRIAALHKAEEFAVRGFVRNEQGGSVFIDAEGDEEKLLDFLKWCRQGPRFATVSNVECTVQDDLRNYTQFVVL